MNWSQESNLVDRSLHVWIDLASILSRETYSVNLYRLLSVVAISLLEHTLLRSALEPVAPWSVLLSKHTVASQSRDVVSQLLLWSLTSDTELTQILSAQHNVSNLSVSSSPSVRCIAASQSSLVEGYSEGWSCSILLNSYENVLSAIVSELDDSLTCRRVWSVGVSVVSDSYSSLTNLANVNPSSLRCYNESVSQSCVLDSIAQSELTSLWCEVCLRSTSNSDCCRISVRTFRIIREQVTRYSCKRNADNCPHKCKNFLHKVNNLKLKIDNSYIL